MDMQIIAKIAVFTPLLGAMVAGLFAKKIGKKGAHFTTILGVFVAMLASWKLCYHYAIGAHQADYLVLYTWALSGGVSFHVGFLLDALSTLMMTIVTTISLLVHIYSIGYMHDDAGYQRFFCYMSLFTFAMLMLVTADNFMQLFFGWEGVGVVSYLLIGFWYTRPSAALGSLKAFLVNRVGDFGFLLGIGLLLAYVGGLDYIDAFSHASMLSHTHLLLWGVNVNLLTVICILLFVGAMGKSAQMPLHVWLPESMEGPTPISALIHAATMVTAGVYMLSRMSPLFELTIPAQSTVLVIGSTGALLLGLVGIVQHDIKKVVAYSTLSQLGYMIAATGACAFSAGMFHLFTHAFFKALLFLGAGSVIIAMHHEQDVRKMGNLARYMPITHITFLVGTLALTAIPPFSGFYSKDGIIDAVKLSTIPGAGYAYVCLLIGAFVTALYSFRVYFLTFHTKERFDVSADHLPHESPRVVTWPLVLLAVPSVFLGLLMVKSILYVTPGLLEQSVKMMPMMHMMQEEFMGIWKSAFNAVFTLPYWFSLFGIFVAWICYCKNTQLPALCAKRAGFLYNMLVAKYGFDQFNDWFFIKGSHALSRFFANQCDKTVIDHYLVNGAGRLVRTISRVVRLSQTGYLYHYAFVMLFCIAALLIFVAGT